MLERVIERARRAKCIKNDAIVTTPDVAVDQMMFNKGVDCYLYGGERNVLEEYWIATSQSKVDVIVRITADCPFVDPLEIDRLVAIHIDSGGDYTYNRCDETPNGWADGMDIEVFAFEALRKARKLAKTQYELEHVTPFMRNSGEFKTYNVENPLVPLNNNLQLSVNTPEEYFEACRLYKLLPENFTSKDIKKLHA